MWSKKGIEIEKKRGIAYKIDLIRNNRIVLHISMWIDLLNTFQFSCSLLICILHRWTKFKKRTQRTKNSKALAISWQIKKYHALRNLFIRILKDFLVILIPNMRYSDCNSILATATWIINFTSVIWSQIIIYFKWLTIFYGFEKSLTQKSTYYVSYDDVRRETCMSQDHETIANWLVLLTFYKT